MAATDKTYRSQKTLDIVFAVSCILMLICTVWMLVVDYNREFKAVQRNFRDVESVLDERQMVSQLPDPAEVERLQKDVVDKRQAVDKAKEGVRAEDQRITALRDERTATFRSIKADFDSKMSFYNIEVEERDQAGISDQTRAERAEKVKGRREELDRIQDSLNNAQKAVDQADAEYKEKVTDPVAKAENELADADGAEKKVAANFDRFAKLTVQKKWGLGDAFRALPILDAFESPTKIRQIVLADLPIEYGSFKYVTRYDRCTSCHLAVERGGFDRATLTKLTRNVEESRQAMKEAAMSASNTIAGLAAGASDDDRQKADANLLKVRTILDSEPQPAADKPADPYAAVNTLKGVLNDLRSSEVPGTAYGPVDQELAHLKVLTDQYEEAKSLPKKLETARRLCQERKDKGENLGFDPGDLPSQARTVSLTPGQITQFAAHPRLDLFVDSNSPHPMDKFGCTVCHDGQGSATSFDLAVHTPADYRQHKQWEDLYQWHASRDWEFPMLSSRFVESSCLKCHHEVTDLVRDGNKEEAPKLLRGYNLVRENGCFGCHEISGIKKGQEVGPDLRLESSPPLDWLTPTEQDKAKADPLNPPGTYRKVGPSLRRIAEKTNEEWVRRWVQSPRGFRPDTKMPHFYNLSNDTPDLLPGDAKDNQKDFPAAEIHSIAHYLLTESKRHLEGKDTYRDVMNERLKELQDQLKDGPLDEKDRKELADVTHRLADLGLLSIPTRAAEIDGLADRLKQTQERVLELYAKKAQQKKAADDEDEGGDAKELAQLKKDLDSLRAELEKAGLPIPIAQQIFDEQGEPVTEALPEPTKEQTADHLGAGQKIFTERGCLACHVNDGTHQAAKYKDEAKNDVTVPAVHGDAEFGPDLSRIAAKVAPLTADGKAVDPKARRRWVVQWVLNPNIYHPRTRMPITHLTVQQACDVADWLLSREVKPEELANWKDPELPNLEALVMLTRLYLAKAPGMTSDKVEEILKLDEILPKEALDDRKVSGFSADDLKHMTRDADERVLAGPIARKDLPDKLEWYIGRKSINRLGCYGCHDVPGYETAKPIGTALNDWGKKDPERLAFEDGDAYVRDHYNVVDARDAAGNVHQADPDWRVKEGRPPYERAFYEALEHHTREGFLHQKLEEPRSYDYHRLRAWDDRLRMPQFRFARARRRPGESDAAFEVRRDREEGEAREAVMTFILGLVAEPIPPKFVNTPSPERLAEAKGRQLLDKYNCVGCHQVRPGIYDFKPSKDTLDALEKVYQNYEKNNAKKDHVFPGHNAWTGLPSPYPDRLVMHGTQAHVANDEDADRDMMQLRLTDALRFTNNDKVVRDIPAGVQAKIIPEDVIRQSPPYGGVFAELLVPYLAQANSTLFAGKPDEARSVLPPPLVREGERVQPKWLYQFLLNPPPIRPQEKMKLRMPKFNMSGEDAMTLVNYFGAADKLSNPGAGLTTPYLTVPQTEPRYWRDRNEEYLKRLKAEGAAKPEERAAAMVKGLVEPLQAKQADAEKAAKDLKGDDLTKKQKEIDDIKDQIKRIKDWEAEVPKEDQSPEAYAADAYRLIAANPNLCTKCHSIGSRKIEGANGPDLSIAWERLRPEWVYEWISNPDRMFAYAPTMPQNFPKDSVDYKEYLAGDSRDRARAARDVLMDLPRLENLPANRATRAVLSGGK